MASSPVGTSRSANHHDPSEQRQSEPTRTGFKIKPGTEGVLNVVENSAIEGQRFLSRLAPPLYSGEFYPPNRQSASFLIFCDYMNNRLRLEHYIWDECPPIPHEFAEKCRAMSQLGELCEKRYREAFDDMILNLQITQTATFPTFMSVTEELFADGDINWGRIVALFTFAGAIACECVHRQLPHMLIRIAGWLSNYVEKDNIKKFIDENGGWDGFVEFSKRRENEPAPPPPSTARRWIAAFGGALGIAALGTILSGRM